jgi:hypothetical protein
VETFHLKAGFAAVFQKNGESDGVDVAELDLEN